MRPRDCEPGGAGEDGLAGQALVEHAAERVDVGAGVHRPALELLRREIGGRADGGPRPLRRSVVEPPRQPEVGEIDVLRAVEQDVRRLDVAVHETARVRGVERCGDLRADGDRPGRLERALRSEQRAKVGAVHEPHREIDTAVDVAGVVDRDDVRVLERHHELRLARESLAEAIVARQGRRHQLERDRSLQAQVVGPVHDAHPAAADQLLDPVPEEVGADVGGRETSMLVPRSSLRLGLSCD